MVLDVVYDVLHSLQLLQILGGNFHIELLFQRHDHFKQVQGIGFQIFLEG